MVPLVTMTDINYFPGLVALVESVALNGGLREDQKIVVIEGERIAEKDRDLLRRYGYDFVFLSQKDYSDVCLDWFTGWQDLNWYSWVRKVLKKIYLFNMKQYEKIVFIDCDMLCMGDLNELFDMPHLSACPDYGSDQFCSGMMVIEPCKEDFDRMIDLLKNYPREILSTKPSGDQVLINHYFTNMKPEKIHLTDMKWGVSKRTVKYPEIFRVQSEDMRLLHYVGYKPWWGSDSAVYDDIDKRWHGIWSSAKQRFVNDKRRHDEESYRLTATAFQQAARR